DGQLDLQLAIAEHLDLVKGSFGEVVLGQQFERDLSAIGEHRSELPDVDREHFAGIAIGEPALGNPPYHRHRAALEGRLTTVAAAALVSLVTATSGFAGSRSNTAADPLATFKLGNAAMDVVEIHCDSLRLNRPSRG